MSSVGDDKETETKKMEEVKSSEEFNLLPRQ